MGGFGSGLDDHLVGGDDDLAGFAGGLPVLGEVVAEGDHALELFVGAIEGEGLPCGVEGGFEECVACGDVFDGVGSVGVGDEIGGSNDGGGVLEGVDGTPIGGRGDFIGEEREVGTAFVLEDQSEGVLVELGACAADGDVGIAECAVVEVEAGFTALGERCEFVGVELSVGVFVLPDAELAVDGVVGVNASVAVGVPVAQTLDTLGLFTQVQVGE